MPMSHILFTRVLISLNLNKTVMFFNGTKKPNSSFNLSTSGFATGNGHKFLLISRGESYHLCEGASWSDSEAEVVNNQHSVNVSLQNGNRAFYKSTYLIISTYFYDDDTECRG